jgi:hypothetical protein
MPTSPGENVRILPPPFIRVPDEQILTPSKRTKRLFAGQCLPLPTDQNEKIFQECIADLRHSEELQELGMALFLDRPLGVFKAPGEPDHTVLLSHEAFSRSIAERRLQFLAEHIPFLLRQKDHDFHRQLLRTGLPSAGAALPNAVRPERPGSVSVYDALKVAPDFVFLSTTRRATHDFLNQFDFTALAKWFALDDLLDNRQRILILGAPRPDGRLTIYDACHRPRLELQADVSLGYAIRAGQEYPRAGLRVLRVWRPRVCAVDMEELDLCQAGIAVPPQV